MEQFSLGESIAALQATMLYGTMRVSISGHEFANINSGVVTTMEVGGMIQKKSCHIIRILRNTETGRTVLRAHW